MATGKVKMESLPTAVKVEDKKPIVNATTTATSSPSSGMSTVASSSTLPAYLKALSPSQLAAATHPPTSCLQILAGPGSGKTRVLTSRVAWLILDESNKLDPQDIVVVTFTNKAANEMKQRLFRLIGQHRTDNLIIGTFHSVCARYLRKYGRLIDLPNNFSIIDADDAKRMLKAILKELKADLEKENLTIKPEVAMSEISKAKAKEIDPFRYKELVDEEAAKGQPSRAPIGSRFTISVTFKSAVATIYRMYQEQLVEANALDFDDLLVYGVKLFREQTQVVRNIKHVLVDEFQDTNVTQYELMRLVARSSQAVSIVGDPDQSIYGWRSAEIKNLDKMTKEFKGTRQARLEENYRSTGAILELALKVVQQDTSRVSKGLYTSHPRGPPVVLRCHGSAQLEAAYLASEIKRLVAHSGGMLTYDDFAILLRFNFLSRAIEAELQSNGIDSRMMGGHKFFDRMEVKDLLAYLALADNPGFTPAFLRVVNVPKRGIGEKTVKDLLDLAKAKGCRPMQLAERAVAGEKFAAIKPATKKGLKDLVDVVVAIRSAANSGAPVSELLELLIEKVNYENYLKAQQDFENRWGNVQELISFSTVVAQNAVSTETNQPSLSLEAVMSNAFSTQDDERKVDDEDDDQAYRLTISGRVKRESGALQHDYDDEFDDDGFQDVPIAAGPAKDASSLRAKSESSSKPQVKREVIDLCLSDDEDGESSNDVKLVKENLVTKPSKRQRTASTHDFFKARVKSESTVSEHGNDDAGVDPAGPSTAPEAAAEGGSADSDEKTPLRVFLEASILSTDMEESSGGQKDESKKPRVTISTCHAAKGLEWPVVFVPAVEDGSYPSFRCEAEHEIAEERRLLYVAMTRAESVLYLTHASARMAGGDTQDKVLSRFIVDVAKRGDGGKCSDATGIAFCTTRPEMDVATIETISSVTGKPMADRQTIESMVKEWEKKAKPEVERVDMLNAGRMSGFGSYSSYGAGAGAHQTRGVHSGATGGWNSQMSFGRFGGMTGGTTSASTGGDGDVQSLRTKLGFSTPTMGSYSTTVDAPTNGQYSGFQRASSLASTASTSAISGARSSSSFGAFSNSNSSSLGSGSARGRGGRTKTPLVPPSRRPAGTSPSLPAAPSFTDSVRLKARPEDSVSLAREDGTAPRPRADLHSFQQAHTHSISNILNLLPPDPAPLGSSDASSTGDRSSPIVVPSDHPGSGSGPDSDSAPSSITATGSHAPPTAAARPNFLAHTQRGKRRLGMSRRL